ncbi:MAG TPA: hypothetical protein VFS20_12825 [Longimicrobium sp.]|nr:hypothetical protein [Longimicrobium sp.]
MKSLTLMAGAALATLVVGCDNAVEPRSGSGGGRTVPGGPNMSVGATSTVVVTCPAKMQTSQSAPCVAYGRDSNGFFTSSTVTSWASTNTTYATITSGGVVTAGSPGTATIQATIGGVTGNTTIAVRTSTDPTPQLILGSYAIKPNVTCSWTADGTGGTGPYTFSFSPTSPATGSQSGDTWTGSSSSTFTLNVTVTDIDGRQGSHGYLITTTANGIC